MPGMMANGFKAKTPDKVKEDRFGPTDQCTRVGGRITKPTAEEDSSMPTEMFMMGSGWTIKLMDMGYIVILMGPNTKDTGRRTNNTAMVLKHGQMEPSMKVSTSKEKSTALVGSLGLIRALSTGNS